MDRKTIFIIITVFLVSFFWRFIFVSEIPNGLYVDEAAIGYNAYSISQTGRDEYGQAFPIFLKSWNAYTPALVAYIVAVPLFFVGNSILALRITPVVLGSMLVVVTSILIYRLIGKRNKQLLMLTGLILAMSPTLILFGRVHYEAVFACLLMFLGISKFKNNNYLGIVLLSLSTYAYHSERIIVYLLLPVLFYANGLISYKKLSFKFFKLLGLFLLTQVPQLFITFVSSGSIVNVASKSWLGQIELSMSGAIFAFHKLFAQIAAFYTPINVFFNPDPDMQRSVPGLSLFFPWMVIPYLAGWYVFLTNMRRTKIIWWMMAIFPIPAALTADPFSILRGLPVIFPISFIIMLGINLILKRFKYSLGLVIVFLVLNIFTLYRGVFVLLPNERMSAWNAGYKEVFEKINEYDLPVLVDSDKPVYILYLFFQDIKPRSVHLASSPNISYYLAKPWSNYYHDQKIRFAGIYWEEDVYKKQLIVATPLAVSQKQQEEHFLSKEFEFKDSLGRPLLTIYQTHPDLKLASQYPMK